MTPWGGRRYSAPVRPCGEPSSVRHRRSNCSGTRLTITAPTPDPVAPSPAGAAAAELQQLLLSTQDVDGFLQELAHLTVNTLPGGLSCGITVRRDHRPTTVASSDARASQVDEVQYQHDQGPCLTSLSTGEVVLIDDLSRDERWGAYRTPALAHGVRSSLSLPLRADDTVIGALNIYAPHPSAFGPPERQVGEKFAEEASRALTLAVRMAECAEMSEHLQSALASRAVIDQALGIVMAQTRCTADQAFDTLRTISQNRNVKLREIAEEMIAAVSGQPPPGTARFSRGPS
ncbi:MAG: GAF and ANTAR domain-containing protein [Pseudonocardia sp.]